MRLMYDSTTATDIPLEAHMAGCYANGNTANFPQVKARFPNKPVVSISVFGSRHDELAHVLDMERGNSTPAQFQGWAHAYWRTRVCAGRQPIATAARFPKSSHCARPE